MELDLSKEAVRNLEAAETRDWNLDDDEKRRIRDYPNREAFVAVVPFKGVRGGKYRSARTGFYRTADEAMFAAIKIRTTPFKNRPIPGAPEILRIDWRGNIVGGAKGIRKEQS